jgi:predicted PurR-regulated permease PerM
MTLERFAAAVALAALTIYLLIAGKAILLPFVIAIFAACLINALASAICRIRIGRRSLPRRLRFAAAIGLVVAATWLAVNVVIGNSGRVMAAAPLYEQNLELLAVRLSDYLNLSEPLRVRALFDELRLTAVIRGAALGLMSAIASIGTVAVYVIFLLLEQHSLRAKLAALFPDADRHAFAQRMLHRIDGELQTYVWLKTAFGVVVGLVSYGVMRLVGIDLAGFWALLIFGSSFIPYLGAWLGVVLPALLALLQFGTLPPFLVTISLLGALQFATGSIIEPRILGTGLNLSPVVMLLSLAVWGSIWGIVGMLLAVPMMVTIMIICSHFEGTRAIAILLSTNGEVRA